MPTRDTEIAEHGTARGEGAQMPPPNARRYANTKDGMIPLIERTITNAYGKVMRYYEYDLDFTPETPIDAVRGDVKRQSFCPLCHTPRYYYVDEERVCIQCSKEFTFSGKEQKYWYEALQLHFNSAAIRCPPCRRRRRSALCDARGGHPRLSPAQGRCCRP